MITSRYAGYLARQTREIETFRQMESTKILPQTDYASVPGLRTEARQALATISPTTLGQASRIPGISPADFAVLCVYIATSKSYG